MSLVEIDYSILNSAIKTANNMDGFWGCYNSYRSDLKNQLQSPLDEWKVPGKEPKGHTYVAGAQSNISSKRSALETRAAEWKTLGTNLESFKTFVEQQDKAVAEEFDQTSKAYTNYHGIGGMFSWLGDAFFGTFAVDFANSNKFTREIADWGKSVSDDVGAWVKDNVIDWFQHGNGRYVANIVGSILLTGAAIAGTVVSFLAIPFTGGLSAVGVVAGIGALASAVCAGISIWNTINTVSENATALSITDDPGMARFHGDVSGYSDYVSKHVYSSPEEFEKHAKWAKDIDAADKICAIVSMTAGLATTFGTKSVKVLDKAGNPIEKKVFDFSGKNIKQNILKTFGFKVETKSSSSMTMIGQEGSMSINSAGELGDTTIDIISQSDDISATSVAIEKGKETVGKAKYTNRVATIDSFTASSEYNSVVASNGVVTGEYTEYAVHAERATKTVDYSNALMSKKDASNISYFKELSKATTAGEATKIKMKHGFEVTEKTLKSFGNGANYLRDTNGKNSREIISSIVKKSYVGNAVDKYVYSLPTKDDATVSDYLKGIGGSNAGKVWSLYDAITNDAA